MKNFFKIGMEVSCQLFGNGIVKDAIKNDSSDAYPILVTFNGIDIRFTYDGRYNVDTKRCLFQFHRDFEEPELKEIFEFKQGDPVWVKDVEKNAWDFRYFSHVDQNGIYHCFMGQERNSSKTVPWHMCIPFIGEPPVK